MLQLAVRPGQDGVVQLPYSRLVQSRSEIEMLLSNVIQTQLYLGHFLSFAVSLWKKGKGAYNRYFRCIDDLTYAIKTQLKARLGLS